MKFFRACPTDSIERLIEDQAFSQSYDFDPPLPPIPLFHQQVSQSFCVWPVELTDRRVRKEPNHATSRKPGPLSIIQYPLMPDISSPADMKFPLDLV